MNLGAMPERNAEIVRRYMAGEETLAVIGATYGITKERVRFIVARAGCWRPRPRMKRIPYTCETCGAKRATIPTRPRRFCSGACRNVSRRARDSSLLDALRDLAHELGRTPSTHDMNTAPGFPSATTYQNHFGSIRAAQCRAGLEPNRIGHPKASGSR